MHRSFASPYDSDFLEFYNDIFSHQEVQEDLLVFSIDSRAKIPLEWFVYWLLTSKKINGFITATKDITQLSLHNNKLILIYRDKKIEEIIDLKKIQEHVAENNIASIYDSLYQLVTNLRFHNLSLLFFKNEYESKSIRQQIINNFSFLDLGVNEYDPKIIYHLSHRDVYTKSEIFIQYYIDGDNNSMLNKLLTGSMGDILVKIKQIKEYYMDENISCFIIPQPYIVNHLKSDYYGNAHLTIELKIPYITYPILYFNQYIQCELDELESLCSGRWRIDNESEFINKWKTVSNINNEDIYNDLRDNIYKKIYNGWN